MFPEKKMKMWRIYDDDANDNDNFCSEKLPCAFSSGELKTDSQNIVYHNFMIFYFIIVI